MVRLICLVAVMGMLALAALSAAAQQYPARPIRLIAPFPPGGGVDVVARTVVEKLGARLGQTIVLDNRPGAGATLGTALASKGTPDGYTLLVAPVIGLAIAHAYYRKLDYDHCRDPRQALAGPPAGGCADRGFHAQTHPHASREPGGDDGAAEALR